MLFWGGEFYGEEQLNQRFRQWLRFLSFGLFERDEWNGFEWWECLNSISKISLLLLSIHFLIDIFCFFQLILMQSFILDALQLLKELFTPTNPFSKFSPSKTLFLKCQILHSSKGFSRQIKILRYRHTSYARGCSTHFLAVTKEDEQLNMKMMGLISRCCKTLDLPLMTKTRLLNYRQIVEAVSKIP